MYFAYAKQFQTLKALKYVNLLKAKPRKEEQTLSYLKRETAS
jgi:hypothetical protein